MTASATVPARNELAHAIEDDLAAARDINNLIDWIGQARQHVDDLRFSADNDTQLDALLRKRRVPAHGPEWSNELQGMGLYRLHAQIEECLRRIAFATGLEAAQ